MITIAAADRYSWSLCCNAVVSEVAEPNVAVLPHASDGDGFAEISDRIGVHHERDQRTEHSQNR